MQYLSPTRRLVAPRALAQGRAVAAALEGSARNPGAVPSVRGLMILGLGMIESVLVMVLVFLLTKM